MPVRQIAHDTEGKPVSSRRQAWFVFVALFALMMANHVDRQIVVSLLPTLKAEWGLSDTQLGGLVSVVSVMVALGVVPLSLLADRWGRAKSITLMAAIWSLATFGCAFAGTYVQLLAARSIVGVGEAAYGTAGAALVASLFPPRLRSTMLGAFLAAAVFGSVLGVVMGGVIAARWGWQAAFGAAGVPGLALAAAFWLLARDLDTAQRSNGAGNAATTRRNVLQLMRKRTVLFACFGGGLQLLVVSTIYAWLPSYLNRYYGMPSDQAGVRTGVVILLGGLGAVLLSMAADWLAIRVASARLYVPAAAAIMTTVLMCGAFIGSSPGPMQTWLLVAGGLVMTGTIGPVTAVIVDVTQPGMRATSTSFLAFIQNLLGLAFGPLLAGALADVYGLGFALSVVPALSLPAALMFALAARTYLADMRRVADSEPATGAIQPRHP